MFDLDKKSCTLLHCNGRHEKHGEDNVLACDLKFKGDFDGDILAEFSPTLRSAMYAKKDGGDLADQGSDTPTAVRFPNLVQPLKFSDEIIGAAVTVAYGIGDIVLETCDINNFRVECKDGGTVTVTFRVQARPTEEQLARLFALLDTSVPITITPPEEKLQQDLKKAA
jgi:hypothetical protein